MAEKVKAVPDNYHTITPYLNVRGAAKALDFYQRAFGAQEQYRMGGPNETIMHAEMRIGDSTFMLADENEDWGNRSPESLGGVASSLMLYVEEVDTRFQQAVDAGATVIMPLQDHFYGDRSGMVQDPFGHRWMLSMHVEDVPPEEMERRAKEAMGAA